MAAGIVAPDTVATATVAQGESCKCCVVIGHELGFMLKTARSPDGTNGVASRATCWTTSVPELDYNRTTCTAI